MRGAFKINSFRRKYINSLFLPCMKNTVFCKLNLIVYIIQHK